MSPGTGDLPEPFQNCAVSPLHLTLTKDQALSLAALLDERSTEARFMGIETPKINSLLDQIEGAVGEAEERKL